MIRAYIAAAACVVLAAAAWWAHHKIWTSGYEAYQLEAQQAAEIQRQHFNEVAEELEHAKANQRVVTQTVTKWRDKIISRDVYRNACFDDDGMRLFNESIKDTDPSKLDAAMSGTDPAK